MKSILIVALLAAVALNLAEAGSLHRTRRQLVPSEFRNIKIEDYLKNPRSVQFQLKCIVYDGPCDRIGKYLKVTIPELLGGRCQNCSPEDKQTAGKLVAHIQKNYPKEWNDAVNKYQGGKVVKQEDAARLESILGVKIETDVVSSTSSPAEALAVNSPAEAAEPVIPTGTTA